MRNYHYHTQGDDLYIFLEYAGGGTLKNKIQKLRDANKTMNENQVKIYTKQILEGLEYLHCVKGVFHRDIKPENVLLTLSENIKISDFGESKFVSMSGGTLKGTPPYIAPEVILVVHSLFQQNEFYCVLITNRKKTRTADIISSSTFGRWGAWSTKCSRGNCSTGCAPSTCRGRLTSNSEKISNLFTQRSFHQKILEKNISQEAKNFLIDCIQVNPMDRKNVFELLKSE